MMVIIAIYNSGRKVADSSLYAWDSLSFKTESPVSQSLLNPSQASCVSWSLWVIESLLLYEMATEEFDEMVGYLNLKATRLDVPLTAWSRLCSAKLSARNKMSP